VNQLAAQLDEIVLLHEKARRAMCAKGGEDMKAAVSETTLKNTVDLAVCIELLTHIAHALDPDTTEDDDGRPPLYEPGTFAYPVLARLAAALHDVSVGSKPGLFNNIYPQYIWHEPGTKATGSASAAAYEGSLAAILDLLVSVLRKREALQWLDAELRRLKFYDAAGNLITAKRIDHWRGNFRGGAGAAFGREVFDADTKRDRTLARAPKSEHKTQRVVDEVSARLAKLKHIFGRQIAPAQRRPER
jgi:hypothetical protein